MVPLGKALQKAGHDVAFATAESFRGAVERQGFTHHRAGLEWDESRIEETIPDILDVPRIGRPIWMMDEVFLNRSPRQMVPDLLAIAEAERPDLLVVNNYEMAGVLVAERLGLPYVTCNISFRWPRRLIKRVCGAGLKTLRRDLGFPADPACAAYGRYLDLCVMPATWNMGEAIADPFWGEVISARTRPQFGMSLKARLVRKAIQLEEARFKRSEPTEKNVLYARPGSSNPGGPRPAALDGLPDQPTVYVSLGTVFNTQFPEVFDVILEGLRDEPINVVMTLGPGGDPQRFGPQPANVRIERFIPQADLLPHVDLCVNHGGYGTVIEPLSLGIPQVILPLSADQPIIALLGRAHGVAALAPVATQDLMTGPVPLPVIDPARLTPADVRDLVVGVLASTELRAAAQRMQATLSALPGPDDVVEALVALAGR